jgi:hypothetical protein
VDRLKIQHAKESQRGTAAIITFGLLMLAATGCTFTGTPRARTDGLDRKVAVYIEPWSYHSATGSILNTDHYRIYTTIDPDDSLYEKIPQILEGAYTQYRLVAPKTPPTDRPLVCYVFARRTEWVDFTRRKTGPMARTYLQIAYGAYALGDVFVAYDIGKYRTLSVAAHEGWHQFASRNFKGRLPPFLEEGVATLFEDTTTLDPLPRWDLSVNSQRVHGLWRSIEHRYIFSLEELVTLDAGDIIHRPGDRINAFYSQNWAFIRYLRDGYGGRYRPAFERLLADVATDSVWNPSPQSPRGSWDRSLVKPTLEHYLGIPFSQMDQEFAAFCRQIASEN